MTKHYPNLDLSQMKQLQIQRKHMDITYNKYIYTNHNVIIKHDT